MHDHTDELNDALQRGSNDMRSPSMDGLSIAIKLSILGNQCMLCAWNLVIRQSCRLYMQRYALQLIAHLFINSFNGCGTDGSWQRFLGMAILVQAGSSDRAIQLATPGGRIFAYTIFWARYKFLLSHDWML